MNISFIKLPKKQRESLDNSIQKTSEEISDFRGVEFVSKGILLSQPFIFIAAAFGCHTLNNYIQFYNQAYELACGGIICISTTIFSSVSYKKAKDELKTLKEQLNRMIELKSYLENNLEDNGTYTKQETNIDETNFFHQRENVFPILQENIEVETFNSRPKNLVLNPINIHQHSWWIFTQAYKAFFDGCA